MRIHQKEKGFTIIEVVLVLAIAGLIFMMVFLALPALQRSQRDTQRKDDLSRAITSVTSYTSNNRGELPAPSNSAWATFLTQYVTTNSVDSFIDPSGANASADTTASTYIFSINGSAETTAISSSFADSQNYIYVTPNSTCGTGGATIKAGSRKVSLRMVLEGGGVYCMNN
jgi:prepilin-type N-terminal cleavage/methylation domain-containing protein